MSPMEPRQRRERNPVFTYSALNCRPIAMEVIIVTVTQAPYHPASLLGY